MSPRKISNGIFLMGIGAILLLNNFGILDWSVWFRLVQLWPVLLITAGIGLIFKDHPLSILGPVILVVAMIYAAATPSDDWKGWGVPFVMYSTGDIEEVAYSRTATPDTKALDMGIEFGAGDLRVKGGSEKLYSADLEYLFKKPYEDYQIKDGTASARFTLKGKVPLSKHGRAQKWDIELSKKIPVALDIDAGACSANLDLVDVNLDRLSIDCGASSINAALGIPKHETEVNLQSGASSISMTIPKGVAVRVEVDSALSSNDFSGMGLVKDGKVWYSPNYQSAGAKYDIHCSNGVGSFELGYEDTSKSV